MNLVGSFAMSPSVFKEEVVDLGLMFRISLSDLGSGHTGSISQVIWRAFPNLTQYGWCD